MSTPHAIVRATQASLLASARDELERRAQRALQHARVQLDNLGHMERGLEAELRSRAVHSDAWWRSLQRLDRVVGERIQLETWKGWASAQAFGVAAPSRRGIA